MKMDTLGKKPDEQLIKAKSNNTDQGKNYKFISSII